MSEHGIFIGWGSTRSGRQADVEKVFGEAVAYWNGLKASGDIDSVEIVLLSAHGGDLGGFALLRGDRARLSDLRMTPAFTRIIMRAEACLESVGVVHAYVDGGVMRFMTGWHDAITDLV
jgi:hypothetical protein